MDWSITLTSPTSSGLVPDSSYPGWAKLTRIFTSRAVHLRRRRLLASWVSLSISSWRLTRTLALLEGVLLSSPSHSTNQTVCWWSVTAATGPRVYHVTSGLLQWSVCELQRGRSSTATTNLEQRRSFGLLRTSLQPRCTTAALVTLVAGCQTYKI